MKAKMEDGCIVCGECGGELQQIQRIVTTLCSGDNVYQICDSFEIELSHAPFDYLREWVECVNCGANPDNVTTF